MKTSVKILLFLLFLTTLASASWYYFKNSDFGLLKKLKPTPADLYNKDQADANFTNLNFVSFTKEISGINGPRTYLILFQNSMELRPTGGFIGSFAKIKVENGKLIEKKTFDSAIFDQTLQNAPEPPYFIKKYLHTDQWGVRDSNWYFDFSSSSQNALKLYHLSPDHKDDKIDGVIGVTTNILPYLIEKTGPIELPDIQGQFTKENCIEKLEYEVELGFSKRGVARHQRKDILKELLDILSSRLTQIGKLEQLSLLKDLQKLLQKKDIQFYFENQDMQNYALKNNWAGAIIAGASYNDYLALVDSNLGALKTNRCLSHKITYQVDFSDPKNPKAKTTIDYANNCREKNFMTDNYHGYTRLYVPLNSTLESAQGFDQGALNEITSPNDPALIETTKDKKIFSNLVYVTLNSQRAYSFSYKLPSTINSSNYQLYFQKQAGLNNPHLKVILKEQTKEQIIFDQAVEKDTLIKK
ncbi:MAG: DUF4012 domain-containing protein [Patescibacteria group bacterium]|nr:DUF4012 domain-containing protein [Patescibacteria group bacterium]